MRIPPSVFLKRERLVDHPVLSVQLIAFVTDDQGGNKSLRHFGAVV